MKQQHVPVTVKPNRERQHRMTAAVLSVVLQGLGQLYNRQWIKGICFLILEGVGLAYLIPRLNQAVWGVWTLGEQTQRFVKVNGSTVLQQGDHSIFLLLNGIIVLLVFFVFLLLYIFNIRDAYITGKLREEGKQATGASASLRYLLDKQFPYLFLSIPALGILFFTIMPILFTITLAFTNYSAPDHIPPAKLVDWVGFKTFTDLIQLKSWSHTFFGVLTWTVIWAILATVTTYFGGVLVALLIEQIGRAHV